MNKLTVHQNSLWDHAYSYQNGKQETKDYVCHMWIQKHRHELQENESAKSAAIGFLFLFGVTTLFYVVVAIRVDSYSLITAGVMGAITLVTAAWTYQRIKEVKKAKHELVKDCETPKEARINELTRPLT